MLSLVGGVISLLAGLYILSVYPIFYDYFEQFSSHPTYSFIVYFLIAIIISLIVGGTITILGAVLYSADKPSSGSLILIGALLGGNVISLLGGGIAFADCTRIKKNQKLEKKRKELRRAEKLLSIYLEENEGKAFTAESLIKRCLKDNQLKLSITDVEKLLRDLFLLGRIKSDTKENINYYFV